ncbi:MAG: hypothetical protein ACD_46C00125G0007 [uncultured bacterium]|nr:MAG: hypothetical protein ACD_46C00125G0007 [uncultured bacterium]
MTNQDFCYWLQGYFEISRNILLTKEKIQMIDGSLKNINEPYGQFTQWLSDLISFFVTQEYKQEILSYFLPEIRDRLNMIFYHVIDNSYDTDISAEESKKIHDGVV